MIVESLDSNVGSATKSSSTFRNKLEAANIATKSEKSIELNLLIESIIENYPLIQVAIPDIGIEEKSVENWNTQEYTPLVAFLPENYDESITERLIAYDASGNIHEIDAKNPPLNPVIIVGENERLIAVPKEEGTQTKSPPHYSSRMYDYHLRGNIVFNPRNSSIISNRESLQGVVKSQRATNMESRKRNDVILKARFVSMSALRSVEGWGRGQPEVELTVAFTSKKGNDYVSDVTRKIFSDDGWYYRKNWWNVEVFSCEKTLDTPILYWDNANYGQYMKYIFMESDGGASRSIKYTLNNTYETTDKNGQKQTIATKTEFDIPAGSRDKVIGDAIVNFEDPVRAVGTRYSTGIFEFWIGIP